MKKIQLLLICLLVQLVALCQGNQINIAAFKAKTILPANPDEWSSSPGALILVAQKAPQTKLFQNKLVVTVKQDGAKICGNSAAAARAEDSFTVRTYQAAELLSAMGGCKILAPGSYSICAQFFNVDNVPISKEQCANFMVEDKPQADKATYTPPQNIAPADRKIFIEKELKAPLTFRWTPLVPRPQGPVSYRLKVWQLMQGQNGTAAMKANQPVIDKEVKELTQTVVNDLYNGPCKPPYMCDWVWNVEAVDREGKVIGSSEPTTFKIIITDPSVGCFKLDTTQYKVECKGFDLQGKPIYHISNLILTNIGSNPGNTGLHGGPVTNYITPVSLVGSGTLSPTSATGILPGGSINISFDIVGATGPTATFVVNSTIPDPGGNPLLYCDKTIGVTVDLPSCTCTYCDQLQWAFGADTVTYSTSAPYSVSLSTSITAPSVPIKSFKAELISIQQNGNEVCFGCNKNDQTFGNITGGTFATWGAGVFPLYSSITTHHTINWFGASGATIPLSVQPINIGFSVPPFSPLSCCDDEIKFCIRYSFTNADCQTCSFVKCYGVTRKHKQD